jgi:hypothetical protein
MCDGVYLSFNPTPDYVALRVEYDGLSTDQESTIKRMSRRLDSYEATTYAVFPTLLARKVYDGCAEISSALFWELFTSLAPLGIGKHRRLSCVFQARSAGPFVKRNRWHPQLWSRDDPAEMADHCERYLKALADFISSDKMAAFSWRDIATVHRNYFKNEGLEMMFNESGKLLFSHRKRTIIQNVHSRTVSFKRRLIVKQGNIGGRLGLFSEIPQKTFEELRSYCALDLHLASIREVIFNSSLAVTAGSYLPWSWRLSSKTRRKTNATRLMPPRK